MVVINYPEKAIGDQIRKKLGRPHQYGQRIYAKVKYGEQETIIGPGQYGQRIYGIEQYGEAANLCGIYRIQTIDSQQTIIKHTFYIPSNPQTVPQQSNRSKFANAIIGWQGLTSDQKNVYNERAKYKNISGYNLYISEYLLSN